MRTPVLLVLAAALAAPLPATAKPCHLVEDPRGDVKVRGFLGTSGLAGAGIDVTTADIKVDGRNVTATAALPSADPEPGTWRFMFNSGTMPLRMTAYIGSDGERYSAEVAGAAGTSVTGSVTGGQLRIVAPLSVFGSAAPRRGTVLSRIALEANDSVASVEPDGWSPVDAFVLVDNAATRRSVTVGKPAC